jgi:carbon-monoxide dehydrogenase large subunit
VAGDGDAGSRRGSGEPVRPPVFRVEIQAVATNKAPVGPCRGIGQNAAVFATERAMDLIAAELGRDPLEIRRRNDLRDDGLWRRTGRTLLRCTRAGGLPGGEPDGPG